MKKLKKSLLGVASLFFAASLLAACDINSVLDAATEILDDSSTKDSTTSANHDNLINYNDETDKYNENVVVLKSEDALTDDQQQFVDKTDGSPDYQVDSEGKPTEATMIVTYERVHAHSSDVIARPAFRSATHIAGEYVDGVYNAEKGVWYSPSKAKLNNKILQLDGYRGYLYNKSHLLAWSLGGDMEAHNLILGTRSQNVGTNKSKEAGGMSYLETKVRKAIYANHQTEIFYQATPIYKANEIMPRGVLVRAYSINDAGKTLNETAYTINTQSGVTIDYTNGTFTTN